MFGLPMYVTHRSLAAVRSDLGRLGEGHYFRSGDTLEIGDATIQMNWALISGGGTLPTTQAHFRTGCRRTQAAIASWGTNEPDSRIRKFLHNMRHGLRRAIVDDDKLQILKLLCQYALHCASNAGGTVVYRDHDTDFRHSRRSIGARCA